MELEQLSASETTVYDSVRQRIDANDFESAIGELQGVLSIAEDMKTTAPDNARWRYSRARALYQIGTLYVKVGNIEQAMEHLGEALSLSRDLVATTVSEPFANLLAHISFESSFVTSQQGDLAAAIALLQEAETACQNLAETEDTVPNRDLWAQCLTRLARLQYRASIPDAARRDAELALQLYLRNMDTPVPPLDQIGLLHELLGNLDMVAGNADSALRQLVEATEWLRKDAARTENPIAKARLMIALATRIDVERRLANHDSADRLIAEADALYDEVPESFAGMLMNTREWLDRLRSSRSANAASSIP